MPEVFQRIISLLPESPAYYPKDQLTDKPERFFVNETIREKILLNYSKEIPYAVEIVTEEFFEDENIIRIRSLIMVERETQKGIIIGKGGSEVDRLKEELKKITGKEVQLNIFEIKRPELEAQLVAASIARQIESRISYRRAIKMAIAASMRMNAEGIKVQISGRLNGAEMARSENYKDGRIPLSTFRADIDYALVEARTTYGRIGIKVWIMKGEVYGKRELSPLVGMSLNATKGKNDKRSGRGARRRK